MTIRKLKDHLVSLVESQSIPEGKILYLHTRVRGLKNTFQLEYPQVTESILQVLDDLLSPRAILVPAYTNASFRYTGVYHRRFSRSEVGRFSEEVRLRFANYRTPDPIYSVLDTSDYINTLNGIDYSLTYGKGSLFDHLNEQDYVILNIGLDDFYATQIHAAERNAQVPYRYNRTVSGVVYYDEDEWHDVDYKTYILDSNKIGSTYPEWNRSCIESSLVERGVLNRTVKDGTRLLWARSKALTDNLTQMLLEECNFMLAK